MAEWSRNNAWRQGQVIPQELARKLDLVKCEDADTRLAVVIAHDCDIAQLVGAEPELEIIVGRLVAQLDGNCTHAKNARKLHLPFAVEAGEVFVELMANAKKSLAKNLFIGTTPDPGFKLTAERHSILQRWLASRYRRAAFPDAFDDRFDRQTKLKDKLTAILKPLGEHIVAVFFDVDDGEEVKRQQPEDTYTLDIYLVSNTGDDPAKAEAAVEAARKKIEAACRERLFVKDKGWQYIELRECMVISDQALTYRQSSMFKRWNIDYMSLREDPQQELLNE